VSRSRTTSGWWRITDPAPGGLGIGQRSVTVSTVGLAPAIRKLADEKMQVRLAVSLHTPDDELRDTLVPVNERWSVDEVLSAARYYADTSGRRVSIEYALIRDINDQPWRAELLAKRLRKHLGQLVHVNVIPLNPTPGSKWDASPKPVEREFVRLVNAGGVACTVRDTRGQEIAAACGQSCWPCDQVAEDARIVQPLFRRIEERANVPTQPATTGHGVVFVVARTR
jgi:23S rRNA (adenine2503-C2)-methyltransferase